MKHAEILIVGDEILDGNIADTNSTYVSQELLRVGIRTVRKVVVGDDKKEIALNLSQALERKPDYLFILGGIGVTPDDVTKEAVAEFFGRPMTIDKNALVWVEGVYRTMANRPASEIEKRYAEIFEGSEAIPNPVGIACGVYYRADKTEIFVLPGVPREVKAMLGQLLKGKIAAGEPLHSGEIKIFGFESDYVPLYEKIAKLGVKLGSYPQEKSRVILVRLESPSREKLEIALSLIKQGATLHREE